ncbi:MAG: GHMP kinase, partial [Halobacteria archaeon]|nr:GHMP kinase [Halobacteria archaeon]
MKVETSARLHFGFANLSLARKRLYGGLGVAIDRPRTVVRAESSSELEVITTTNAKEARNYAERAVELLGVEGASVEIEREIPRHVGLGSGTQLALAVVTAIAGAHDIEIDARQHAPSLGRGGRSGVGVATFERGGFVLDAGHPAER